MVSNQVMQNTVDGLHNITGVELAVADMEGHLIAISLEGAAEYKEALQAFVASSADNQIVDNCQFFKVYDKQALEYVILVRGSSQEETSMVGRIAMFQIQELMVAYQERYDKDNFIKNLLLDNLLLVDIYNRSKKLHIDVNVRRVVIMVEMAGSKEGDEIERISSVFNGKSKDFVTAVDEHSVVVVKELGPKDDYDSIYKTAQVIMSAFGERSSQIRVSYGTIVNEIKDVSRSYKEAGMALDVGKIFFEEKNIIAYSTLGIGRLIYQLPIPLCKMFIKEILGDKTLDDFDEEMLTTINKFFENSLNVSETSRQLYIHRNTLVYRLDKLQKSTNLDLRIFEDAITFKIALMVVRYMKYMETQNF